VAHILTLVQGVLIQSMLPVVLGEVQGVNQQHLIQEGGGAIPEWYQGEMFPWVAARGKSQSPEVVDGCSLELWQTSRVVIKSVVGVGSCLGPPRVNRVFVDQVRASGLECEAAVR
jgi:hypothetical protein